MSRNCSYLFALSFTFAKDSGVALVCAPSERAAFSILKNTGRYSAINTLYRLVESKNLGIYIEDRCELIYESYTCAATAYEAIVQYLSDFQLDVIAVQDEILNKKADKVPGDVAGHVAILDEEGNLADGGAIDEQPVYASNHLITSNAVYNAIAASQIEFLILDGGAAPSQ